MYTRQHVYAINAHARARGDEGRVVYETCDANPPAISFERCGFLVGKRYETLHVETAEGQRAGMAVHIVRVRRVRGQRRLGADLRVLLRTGVRGESGHGPPARPAIIKRDFRSARGLVADAGRRSADGGSAVLVVHVRLAGRYVRSGHCVSGAYANGREPSVRFVLNNNNTRRTFARRRGC